VSGACTTAFTSTCYESHNNVSGLSANKLSIDDGVGYFIDGNAITLGSGGITAAPSVNDSFGFPELRLPITLGAAQTWSIAGGSEIQQLTVNSNVSGGTLDTLDVVFPGIEGFPSLDLYEGDVEVGAVTVQGNGGVFIGGSLNGADGNPVSLSEGAQLGSLFGKDVTIGPLTTTEDNGVEVGQAAEGGAGTLAVNGGVTLDSTSTFATHINQPGTTAGTDFSQLSASGAVKLEGAELALGDGLFFGGETPSCEALAPGDVDVLVTTTGSLTGTFVGIPNEAIVQVKCTATGTAPTARINYTAHSVTATILTAGAGAPPILTATALQVSNTAPATGEAVTYTATVTPQTSEAEPPPGSVEFLDGGQPIAGCSAQPLTQSFPSSTATCMLTYPAAGSHSITASFAGNVHYAGSSSTAQAVTVHASSTGGGGGTSGGGSTATPPLTSTPPVQKPKPLTCKKGFKKKKVHGKFRCVRIKHKHHKKR
jgi:hypothetical protein